eukprot:4480549-Prymnesium_polylepis.1
MIAAECAALYKDASLKLTHLRRSLSPGFGAIIAANAALFDGLQHAHAAPGRERAARASPPRQPRAAQSSREHPDARARAVCKLGAPGMASMGAALQSSARRLRFPAFLLPS